VIASPALAHRISLDQIRTHLYIKSGLTTYKQRHARHQKGNTRACKTIDVNDVKIKIFQDKYNMARKVLISLGANKAEMEWKQVKDMDLRCLEDEELNEKCEERCTAVSGFLPLEFLVQTNTDGLS
jgi:hypothetical protein